MKKSSPDLRTSSRATHNLNWIWTILYETLSESLCHSTELVSDSPLLQLDLSPTLFPLLISLHTNLLAVVATHQACCTSGLYISSAWSILPPGSTWLCPPFFSLSSIIIFSMRSIMTTHICWLDFPELSIFLTSLYFYSIYHILFII